MMPVIRGLANYCLAAATCWSNVVIPSPLFWRDEFKISFLSSKTACIVHYLTANSLVGRTQIVRDPARAAFDIRLVLALGADAGDAQEFAQLRQLLIAST